LCKLSRGNLRFCYFIEVAELLLCRKHGRVHFHRSTSQGVCGSVRW